MKPFLVPCLVAGASVCAAAYGADPVPVAPEQPVEVPATVAPAKVSKPAQSAPLAPATHVPEAETVIVAPAPHPKYVKKDELGPLFERIAAIEKQQQNQGVLALFNQVSSMKSDVARLRGQHDELLHRLLQAEKRTKDLFGDLDGRLKDMDGRIKNVDAQINVMTKPVLAPQSVEPIASKTVPQLVAVVRAAPDLERESKAYEEALKHFKDGDYKRAAEAFQGYIDQFPASGLAANAYYWLGLSRFSLDDFSGAIAAHQQLQKNYPNSAKVPDAMVNMARAHMQLAENDNAGALLERVINEYPVTRAADIARKMQVLLR